MLIDHSRKENADDIVTAALGSARIGADVDMLRLVIRLSNQHIMGR